jgi:hypothetical protein
MASNGTVFRSQIGGFNREDVNNYIKETDMKYAAQIEDLKAELEKAAARIRELSAENEASLRAKETAEAAIEEAGRKAEEAEGAAREKEILLSGKDIELASAKERIAQLEETVEGLRSELEHPADPEAPSADELSAKIEELTNLAKEKDDIIVSLNDEIERLNSANVALTRNPEQETVEEPDRESPAYKLQMYDKISSQIGDILINANRNADEIVSAAKKEAEKITAELAEESARNKERARNEAEALVSRIHEISSDTAQSLNEDIRRDAESCVNELNLFIENMQFELQALLSKISGSRDEINDRLTFFHRNSAEEIEKKLNETGALFSNLTGRGENNEE